MTLPVPLGLDGSAADRLLVTGLTEGFDDAVLLILRRYISGLII